MSDENYVVVYRGFDLSALDLVESMLQAEGITPRRQGKTVPSMLGLGNAALEQLIAVAPERAAEARALIAASDHAQPQSEVDDLEAQALGARSVEREGAREEDADAGGVDVKGGSRGADRAGDRGAIAAEVTRRAAQGLH